MIIRTTDDPWCEHCGQLEPFTMVVNDGCSDWCETCIDSVGEYDFTKPSDEDIEVAVRKANRQKITYFKKRIKQLEERV